MAQEADTTMDERIKAFVGWDAYKDCISVPARDAGRETARFCWHDGADLNRLLRCWLKLETQQR